MSGKCIVTMCLSSLTAVIHLVAPFQSPPAYKVNICLFSSICSAVWINRREVCLLWRCCTDGSICDESRFLVVLTSCDCSCECAEPAAANPAFFYLGFIRCVRPGEQCAGRSRIFSLRKLSLVLSGVKLFGLYLYKLFIVAAQSLRFFCDLWHKSCTKWRWPDSCAAAFNCLFAKCIETDDRSPCLRLWGNAEVQLLQSRHPISNTSRHLNMLNVGSCC